MGVLGKIRNKIGYFFAKNYIEELKEKTQMLEMQQQELLQTQGQMADTQQTASKQMGDMNGSLKHVKERLGLQVSQWEETKNAHTEQINVIYEMMEEKKGQLFRVEENVRQNNEQIAMGIVRMDGADDRLGQLEANVRNNNDRLEAIKDHTERLNNIEVNLRANNQSLEKIDVKLRTLKNQDAFNSRPVTAEASDGARAAVEDHTDNYDCIDYFDFEDHFRGSQEVIRENQEQYLPYFEGKKKVLDLGCGRGEFLELLKEAGIGATGIDFYPEFATYCEMKGLDVVCGDAIAYLKASEPVDGIMAAQLIEHLTTSQLVELCNTAYERLEEGGYLIMETPNPTCLGIYTHAFYIDPSHQKPVHPLTVQYFLEKAGFTKINVVYTNSSKLPVQIPKLAGEHIENIDAFNEAMQTVTDVLFGSQDYAIIAQK